MSLRVNYGNWIGFNMHTYILFCKKCREEYEETWDCDQLITGTDCKCKQRKKTDFKRIMEALDAIKPIERKPTVNNKSLQD
jgi:hypothetical protein